MSGFTALRKQSCRHHRSRTSRSLSATRPIQHSAAWLYSPWQLRSEAQPAGPPRLGEDATRNYTMFSLNPAVSLTDARLEAAFGSVSFRSRAAPCEHARTSPVLQDSRPRCRIAAVVSGRIALPVRKGLAATCAGIPGAGKRVLSAASGFGGAPAMCWRVQRRCRATRRSFRTKPPNSALHREMSVFIFGLIREITMYFAALTARGALRTRSLSENTKLLYRFTWGYLSPKEDFDFRALAEL
jgi:hypothetical protein